MVVPLGNLTLDSLHEHDQFFGLMVSFGLLTHLLESCGGYATRFVIGG